ncbi:MAG TPA: hypothetical protein VGY30_10680 [Solirubrobacteraceae bacterium]|nr:hypothetical protein [Solirubrobacteraceae bacterium]
MSRTEDLDTAIWSDPDFEVLTTAGKLTYLWSWSNPLCGPAGLYRVSLTTIGHGCSLSADDARKALEELEEARFVSYDGRWLWVRSRVKHYRPKSWQCAKAVVKDIAKVPANHAFRSAWTDLYGTDPWLREYLESDGLVTVSDPMPTVSDGHHTVTDLAVSHDIRDGHHMVTRPYGDHSRERERERVGSTTTAVARARKPSKRVDPESLPAHFPEQLVPVADETLKRLRQLQAERGGTEPSRRGVGLAIKQHPNRDHLAVLGDIEHWALAGRGQAKPVKDWVATFRTFLGRTPAGSPPRPASEPRLVGTDPFRKQREREDAIAAQTEGEAA